jgi:hypothetical protein
MMKFIRTTHDENGQWRPFSPAAWQFWQAHGSLVGQIIRPETALSFEEIATACQEYAQEQQLDGFQPEASEQYVGWCLAQLLGFDMLRLVPAAPDSIRPATATGLIPVPHLINDGDNELEPAGNWQPDDQAWPNLEAAWFTG